MKCLDTDLLVGILRRKEDARKKVERLEEEGRQSTTSINAFELFYGASRSQRTEENVKAAQVLLSRLSVLPLGLSAAEKAGKLFASFQADGMALDLKDAFIAAVALENRMVLVTRNTEDFSRVPGLSLEKW